MEIDYMILASQAFELISMDKSNVAWFLREGNSSDWWIRCGLLAELVNITVDFP